MHRLARPAARGASLVSGIFRGNFPVDPNGFLHTLCDFRKRYPHPDTQIAPAHLHRRSAARATRTSTSSETHIAEYITELTEYIVDIHLLVVETTGTPCAGLTACSHTGMAELVIASAFVRVGQHVVGLGGFLEFFLCLFVAGIFIGMILQSQLAIRLFQIIRAGIFDTPNTS